MSTTDPRLAPLHAIVCRVRPDGVAHAFVFDPQGILSDCRYILSVLPPEWYEHDADFGSQVSTRSAPPPKVAIIARKRDVEVSPLGTLEATCNAYGCKQIHGREIRIGVHVTRLCDEHLAELRRQLRA